jgi:molecular chaperone DnaK (HSP70)
MLDAVIDSLLACQGLADVQVALRTNAEAELLRLAALHPPGIGGVTSPDDPNVHSASTARESLEQQDGPLPPDPLLLDLTPLTLGVRIDSGVMLPVLPRGTPIPATRSFLFPVPDARPDSFRLEFVQGERAMASDNRPLGTCVVNGLSPFSPGAAVRVTLTVDADGILSIAAHEASSGTSLAVVVQGQGGLSRADGDAMVQGTAEFSEADEAIRQRLLRGSRWVVE